MSEEVDNKRSSPVPIPQSTAAKVEDASPKQEGTPPPSPSDLQAAMARADLNARERRPSDGSAGGVGARIRSLTNTPERVGLGRVNVLAIDASDHARNAYEWYIQNIHRQDDLLVLINVPEAPKLPFFKVKSGINPPVEEWKKTIFEINKKVGQLEEDYSADLIHRKIKYKMRQESSTRPAEVIMRIAEEENADLIVMGSRGLGALKRAVLGSVSDSVLRNTTRIPVVVVPKKTLVGEARERSISFERERRLSGSLN